MKRFICLMLAVLMIFCACGKKNENPDVNNSLDNATPADTTKGDKVTGFYVDGSDATQPPEESKAPEEEESRLSFVAVGDNIIYQCGFTDAQNRANDEYPEYNFTPIYENILPQIQAADLAFINQETLMAGAEYGYSDYPCFNSPQHLGHQLAEMGFDIVSIANNHMLDMTTPGLEDTIEFWKTIPEVTMIGGYEDEESYNKPCVIEKNGISMALLSYTYGTNGISPSSLSPVVVPYLEEEQLVADIRRVRDSADMVIVSVHWGNENQFEPTEEQKHLAQVMCDEGVSVIIGTHPHVIQPVEWLTNDAGNKTLCIYSLGDLVAVMMKAANMLGGLCSFDIVKEGEEIRIENVLFEPVVHHFGPSYYNSKLYYLNDFTDELASTFGKVYGISADYNSLCDIVTDVIDSEFLPDYLKENVQ